MTPPLSDRAIAEEVVEAFETIDTPANALANAERKLTELLSPERAAAKELVEKCLLALEHCEPLHGDSSMTHQDQVKAINEALTAITTFLEGEKQV